MYKMTCYYALHVANTMCLLYTYTCTCMSGNLILS